MKKQIFFLILLVVCFTGVSAVEVRADWTTFYNIEKGNVTITKAGTYVIGGTNTKTANCINVAGNITGDVNIIIDNVNIYVTAPDKLSGLTVCSGTNVKLTLKNNNTIEGASYAAGVDVESGASLTITEDSTGKLTSIGSQSAAGIGGDVLERVGRITINGGTVIARGGNTGAGIGSGYNAFSPHEEININGGHVEAYGGSDGAAGIGGGAANACGRINITGGTVIAVGTGTARGKFVAGTWVDTRYAADIGSGADYNGGGSCKITGGSVKMSRMGMPISTGTYKTYYTTDGSTTVYLATLQGLPANKSVIYSLDGGRKISASTDSDGKLFLWHPSTGLQTTILASVEGTYYKVTGTVTTGTNNFTATKTTMDVPVNNITLDKEFTYSNTETVKLTATIYPSNATDKYIIWSSSNPDVATVNNMGVITPVYGGATTITATTNDGGFKATCVFAVNAEPPTISSDLSDVNVNAGETAELSVTASSVAGELKYQWYSNTIPEYATNTPIDNARTSTFKPPTTTGGTTYYFCEIINWYGGATASTVTKIAKVTVNVAAAPIINASPSDTTVNQGDTAMLSVDASTTSGALLYQWYSNTINTIAGATKIIGGTNSEYSPLTTSLGTTYYYCVVTSTLGTSKETTTSGIATVIVKEAPPTVTSVTVNPETISVQIGNTRTFSASVVGTNNPAQTVIWGVTGGVTGTSIDINGKLTVAADETASTLTVTATSTEDDKKSGIAIVTVTQEPPSAPIVDSVTITPATATVQKGNSQTFSASVVGTNNPAQTVIWAVTGGVTGTSIDINGKLTVAAEETASTLTVMATSTADDKKSRTVTVMLTEVPPPAPTVDSVTVTPATATVQKGNSQTFSASVVGTNNPAQTVTWSVTGGVTGTSIDINGKLTVATEETASMLTVTATSTENDKKSGTVTITLTEVAPPAPVVDNVTVTPATATVQKGNTQTFSAEVTGTNNPAQTVIWSVTGGVTGTSIDINGKLKVAADETASMLTVTATSTENDKKSGTVTVTLTEVPPPAPVVDNVTVTPATATVQKGNTQTFSAEVAGTNNPAQTVIWSVTGGVTGTSIDINGKLTVAADETASTLTVTATSTENDKKSGTVTVTLTEVPLQTYALTIAAGMGGSITIGSAGNYEAGTVINIAATASTNYIFSNWTCTGGGSFKNATSASTTFTMPAGAVSITGNFTYNGDSGSSGSSSGGSIPNAATDVTIPAYTADVSGSGITGSALAVAVDQSIGRASLNVEPKQGNAFTGGGAVIIIVPSISGVDAYTLGIPVAYLSTPDGKGTLTFSTNKGSMTLPADMLEGIAGTEGKKAEITIGFGDKSGLSVAAKAAIGDRPLIQLAVTIDGKHIEWNNPNTPVTIAIPYKPTAAELANPESIIIWYIDGSGKEVSIPNGHYDPKTGTVTFVTTHFSYYAVGYNQVEFNDVAQTAWYSNAVSYIAARGITSGTGNGNYSPDVKLTRGDFLAMMMKAYGIAPDTTASNNFSDAGNTYYTGYLAAAKRLDISGGVGDNMFAPNKEITRQEMFTLLYNALKAISKLPTITSEKQLSTFSDAVQIADWAKDAVIMLLQTGTISGSNGKIFPADTTTRAEMAQVLYNLLFM